MCIYWKSANVRGHGPDTSHFDDMQYRVYDAIDIHYSSLLRNQREMCATAVARASKIHTQMFVLMEIL